MVSPRTRFHKLKDPKMEIQATYKYQNLAIGLGNVGRASS